MMMRLLESLNAAQRAAVTAGDGPVLIVAGPGTGKTKTLTARIAYLVESGCARPEHILALTFTKKAAEEMQARVGRLLASVTPAMPRVATFHAVCHTILGNERAFASEADRLQVIKSLSIAGVRAPYKGVSVRELGLLVSRYKNQAENDEALGVLVAAYDEALARQGLCDFDDLLVQSHTLLRDNPDVCTAVQQQYTHVLVDEFQDTNMLQYALLRLLLAHDNIFVIGDPNQSIYGFRGASGGIFGQFRADYPVHTAITLDTNYRSVPAIVAAGNAVFPADVQLAAHRTADGTARAVEVLNEYSEANRVVDTIHQAVGGGDFLHAVSNNRRTDEYALRDFAILYRSRPAAVAVQKAIAASGLPYQIVGDGSPYDQPPVQRICSVLRALALDGLRVPDGLSSVEWQAAQRVLLAVRQPADAAAAITKTFGIELSPDVQHFIGTLVRFSSVASAVAYIDTIAAQNFYDPAADAVTLLTIHASKGLEFPYVFLVGAEDGILPGLRADADEEQRLFYVAVTRARDNLDILHTRRRGGKPATVSSFVRGLSEAVLPRMADPQMAADQRRMQKRSAKRSQQSLF